MPEYFALRATLGFCELLLVWFILRRDLGWLIWFGVYLYLSGTVNLAPASLDDQNYKIFVQLPMFALTFAAAVMATADCFLSIKRHTYPGERRLILLLAEIAGFTPVVAAWRWEPANFYQAFMICRQYGFLALSFGMLFAWRWITHSRPVAIKPVQDAQGWLWCVWLMVSGILASTTSGGLLWAFYSRKNGMTKWQIVSDLCLSAQILLVGAFSLNLRRNGDGALRARGQAAAG